MLRIFSIILLTITISSLSGCGRVSHPKQPDGSFYPHTYIVTSNDNSDSVAGMKDDGNLNEITRDSDSHIDDIKLNKYKGD